MSILTEAEYLINGPRQDVYGHPFDNFTLLSSLWAPVLNVPITPEQVAICLIQLKISRLVNSPGNRDSVVDIAGYAGCLGKIQEYRQAAPVHPTPFSIISPPSPVIAIPEPLHVVVEDTMPGAEVE